MQGGINAPPAAAAPIPVVPVDHGREHAASEVHSHVDAGAVCVVDRQLAGDAHWRGGRWGDPSLVGQVAKAFALHRPTQECPDRVMFGHGGLCQGGGG